MTLDNNERWAPLTAAEEGHGKEILDREAYDLKKRMVGLHNEGLQEELF